MMTARRHVRTVALTAPSERLVRTGATLLADALRIATIAGSSPGRVLIIRALTVGDIRADAGPATLALAVDRRVAQLEAAAVAWDDPDARNAPAVFFEDDCEPYVALALQLAREGRADAWFWPLAVREWRPALSRDDAFRAIVAGVLRTRAGPGGLLRLVDELAERDALDPVLGMLRPEDGAELLRAGGWTASEAATAGVAPHSRAAGVPRRWRDVLERWVARWSVTDARSIWLCAMALATSHAARLADVRLASDARVVAATLTARTTARQEEEVQPLRHPATAANAGVGDAEPHPHAPIGLVRRRHPMSRGTATPNAGLSFVIPMMARLGMATYLASRPHLTDEDFGRRVLGQLASRLSIPDDDPVLRALGDARADARVPIDAHLVAWVSAIRHWCRRDAKIPLATLVRRRGEITATRTHIDVAFALREADVRVRKGGLDLDPGWVPWLGRVVRFHYRDD
jgi:hypothetical protein